MMKDAATWSYLWRYLHGSRLRLLGCVTLALLQSIGLLPIAWFVRRAFDVVIPARDVSGLLLVGFEMLALNAFASGITLATRFASLRTTKQAISSMRRDLVLHCYALPRTYHDSAERGKLHTLFVQDTLLVDVMINALIANFVPSLVLGIALTAILAVLNLRLLSLLLLVMPVLFLGNRQLGAKVREMVKLHREAFTRFSSGTQFLLQRIDLTRYQCAEEFETQRQYQHIETLRVDSQRMAWHQSAYSLAQSSAVTLAGIVILVIGGVDVVRGHSSLGSLMSFYVATIMLSSSLQQLLASVPHIIEGRQALSALCSFSDKEARTPYSGTTKLSFKGSFELVSVCFGHRSANLLDNVSLRLDAGSVTVVMGPNGSGKTTLARLILGLYRPYSGLILADGTPYDQLDIGELRKFIAFTPQDPVIFAGTIRENLTYGLPNHSDDKVMTACRIALVDEFVQQLPLGYEMLLDEDGGTLSGGQRQKIAIARALARQPRLLILDEPTNHLDEESVRKLLNNLASMPTRTTTLIITQDPRVAEVIPTRYSLNKGKLTLLRAKSDQKLVFQEITPGDWRYD